MSTGIYGTDFDIKFRKISTDDIDILSEFDCGNSRINNFIRNRSLKTSKDATYIFVDNNKSNIIAFCSICCNGITINEDDEGREYTTIYPAVEIDFFAVDERYKSIPVDSTSKRYETLSQALFLYMIKYIRDTILEYVGAEYICLYSVPKALNFYKRCGFEEFRFYMKRDEAPFIRPCIPMFMTLKTGY